MVIIGLGPGVSNSLVGLQTWKPNARVLISTLAANAIDSGLEIPVELQRVFVCRNESIRDDITGGRH